MLHLVVNKEFTYLNYISVMSAILGNKVKIWIVSEPKENKYWDLVKKVRSIEFEYTTVEKGISLSYANADKTGRLDAIYLGTLSESYANEYAIAHDGLYDPEETGEFEKKDMTIVKVTKPEVVTMEFVRDSGTLLSALIKRVLFERVWKQ